MISSYTSNVGFKITACNRKQLESLEVNLVYGAFHLTENPNDFISSLIDDIGKERVEVDMLEFNGPQFDKIDNRILCLQLVENGLSDAIMFDRQGFVVQAAEKLYKNACLIERGSFRPVTQVNLDMLENAKSQFVNREDVEEEKVEVFMELTLGNLLTEGDIDHNDFLARIEVINACGYGVLVSNYFEYFRLSAFLRRHINKPIGLVMGLNNLADIFKEEYYSKLDGGILEAFGILFKDKKRSMPIPLNKKISSVIGNKLVVEIMWRPLGMRMDWLRLITYWLPKIFETSINMCGKTDFGIHRILEPGKYEVFSRDILDQVRTRAEGWKKSLPECVVEMIETKKTLVQNLKFHVFVQSKKDSACFTLFNSKSLVFSSICKRLLLLEKSTSKKSAMVGLRID